MEQNEMKAFVAERLANGVSLSDIQKQLGEKGVIIRFLDLRLMASELENVDWTKLNKKEAPKEADLKTAQPNPPQQASEDEFEEENFDEDADAPDEEETPADGGGATVVELSKVVRPGAVASGSVKFASGITAEWILDQHGRLGLDKPTGKPTPADIKGFQMELERLLTGGGR